MLLVIIFKTGQGRRTPARILRSSSKSQSTFTAIQDTPKGNDAFIVLFIVILGSYIM